MTIQHVYVSTYDDINRYVSDLAGEWYLSPAALSMQRSLTSLDVFRVLGIALYVRSCLPRGSINPWMLNDEMRNRQHEIHVLGSVIGSHDVFTCVLYLGRSFHSEWLHLSLVILDPKLTQS